MADAITIKALQDASLDAKSLEEVVNGNEVKQVTTRKGETYPSVKKALTQMFENGGLPATPFATKALMTASALVDGEYSQVTDDTVNNGLYYKEGGAWVKSDYDPLVQANNYTDRGKQEAIDAANSYTDVKTEAIERKVKHQGVSEVALSFVSSDDKDLGHINSDGGFVLSGERETLQEQISAVPRRIGDGAALHIADENGQSLLSIRADGGIMPAGEDASIQEQFEKRDSKNRLTNIVASQDYDSSRVLFKNIVANDEVEPLKLHTRLSTHDTLPTRAFNRMASIIKIPSGLLLLYCKRIHPYDGDRRGCKLMQRFVDIDENYQVTNVTDEVLIEAPSVDTGLVKHQMLGRAPNGTIVMMYDVREDEDVNYRQYVRISSDNGVSWSEPVEFAQNPLLAGRRATNSATGTMVTLDSGRMLVPLYSPNRIWFAYSDDNGVTWNHGAIAGTDEIPNDINYALTESGLTIDANGDLLLTVRPDNREVHYKLLYKSTDEGLTIQFYRRALELVSTFCASPLYYDEENGLMFHGTPSFVDYRARKDYNIQVSVDNGASFPITYKPFSLEWYVGYAQIIKYAKDTYMCVFEGDEVYNGSNYSENIAILTFNTKEVLNNVRYSKV